MTTGTVAGMLLRDLVLELENPWTDLYDPGRLDPRGLPSLVAKGAHDAKRLIGDRLGHDEPPEAVGELANEEGQIVRIEGERVAVSRDAEGAIHAVSATCTHLGCIVSWNDAEQAGTAPATARASRPPATCSRARRGRGSPTGPSFSRPCPHSTPEQSQTFLGTFPVSVSTARIAL